MPRGTKVCPKCGVHNGPRAWNCDYKKGGCGFGFTLRGEKKPDLDLNAVTPEQAKSDRPQTSLSLRLWNLVEPCDESEVRKQYDMKGQSWQSKCGKYRIREQYTFMGVNMKEHYAKCIYLLKNVDGSWERLRPKGRFKSHLAALKRMVKDQKGQKPKATTHKERLEEHIALKAKRKSL
jgi:ribosomal protein L40E